MPTFTRGETSLHYEVHGSGYPVLLFAPGGMKSAIPFWDRAPLNPVRDLAGSFRTIVMDQRNAGESRAPIAASDGWETYASDHAALLDHLDVPRCHVLGMCIGGAFALGLAKAAPARVTAAVLQQPIGFSGDNRGLFEQMFDGWAQELGAARPDVTAEALAAMKARLYGGDFTFAASRDDVRACPVPLLVLRGNDPYHPAVVSEEIARIAPHAELVTSWKEGADLAAATARVKAFLAAHTPASG